MKLVLILFAVVLAALAGFHLLRLGDAPAPAAPDPASGGGDMPAGPPIPREFQGPVGPPHVNGPTGDPPNF